MLCHAENISSDANTSSIVRQLCRKFVLETHRFGLRLARRVGAVAGLIAAVLCSAPIG
jgi:hypothetical protein